MVDRTQRMAKRSQGIISHLSLPLVHCCCAALTQQWCNIEARIKVMVMIFDVAADQQEPLFQTHTPRGPMQNTDDRDFRSIQENDIQSPEFQSEREGKQRGEMTASPLYLTGDLLDRMDLVITKVISDNEPRLSISQELFLIRVYLHSRVRFNLEPFSYLYGRMKQNHVRIQLYRVRDAVGRIPFVSVGTIIHGNVSNTSQHILPYSGLLGDLSCRLLTLHRLSDNAMSYSAYQALATHFYGHSKLSSVFGFTKLVGDRGLLASWVMLKLANPMKEGKQIVLAAWARIEVLLIGTDLRD